MPIYFRNTPVREPFIFDSIGADWVQEATSRPDGHPLYHYLQTVSGCGRITIQGKNYFLNENEGVLIAPSIRHSYAARTPVWLTCFATFTGTVEGSIPRILKNRSIIFIEKEQGARIGEMLRHTTHKYGAPPLNTQELSLDCYQLLLQFVEGLSDKALLEDPLYLRYVAPIVEQIETHYNSPFTVGELSRTVYVTPQYLSRLFRRFLGCSVYEYLTSCRISRAKELLLTYPHLEIQEIAGQVGFSDPSHFIAMFKKSTGRTPLDFRRFH